MFLFSTEADSRFLLKQVSLEFAACGEVKAYGHLAKVANCQTDFFLKPRALFEEISTICIPYVDEAETLASACQYDIKIALDKVGALARKLCNSALDHPKDKLQQLQRLSIFPYPPVEALGSLGAGVIELVQIVQAENLVSTDEFGNLATLPFCLSHGDIKLDNIILVAGCPVLIDWELSMFAPFGFDICALYSAVIVHWVARKVEIRNFISFSMIIQECNRTFQALNSQLMQRQGIELSANQINTMMILGLLAQLSNRAAHLGHIGTIERQVLNIANLLRDEGDSIWLEISL